VRITERFWPEAQPQPEERGAAATHIDSLLDTVNLDFGAVQTWIGVAGTATTLAGVYLGLDEYDRSKVHGARLPMENLGALLAMLANSTVEEIRALKSMHPQRADVITAGTLIASRVGQRLPAAELLVSESDILDGIALELLDR